MKTTFSPIASIVFIAMFAAIFLAFSITFIFRSNSGLLFLPYLVMIMCALGNVYMVRNYLYDYSCDNKMLTIRNTYIKTAVHIPLIEIRQAILIKNRFSYNIKITHDKDTITLNGTYINNMQDFYIYLLKQAGKDISHL